MGRPARRRGGSRWPHLGGPLAAVAAFALLIVIVVLGLSTADRIVRGKSRRPAASFAKRAETAPRKRAPSKSAPAEENTPAGDDGAGESAPADLARDEILIDVLNGCGERGAAEAVAQALRHGGFDVIDIGNAPGFGFDETIVVDRVGKPEVRREVAGYLGCENVVLERRRSSTTAVTVVVGKDYRMLRLDEKRAE